MAIEPKPLITPLEPQPKIQPTNPADPPPPPPPEDRIIVEEPLPFRWKKDRDSSRDGRYEVI